MKIRKYLKKAACIAASAAVMTASSSATVFARDYYGYDCKSTKISAPNSVQGEVDGLSNDRNTSYNTQMAERNGSIYIATYRNVLVNAGESLSKAYGHDFMSGEVRAINNVITNGDIPETGDDGGAYLMKYDKKSGNFSKLYTFPNGTRITAAITYGEDVYFSTYAVYGENIKGCVYKCDTNDKIEEVTDNFGALSSASQCIYNNKLYLAGIHGKVTDVTSATVFCFEEDGGLFPVADYNDFGEYASSDLFTGISTVPSMALTSYKGYIYLTMPHKYGPVLFRGHSAEYGEKANEYGWHWEKIVGTDLDDSLEVDEYVLRKGYSFGPIYGATVVFNDELYLYNCDNVINGFVDANKGIAEEFFSVDDVYPSQYLGILDDSLVHHQNLWKFNDNTGKFEVCKGFSELMKNTCNEYVWSAEVYNGELYLATMDMATVYGYLTKFAGKTIEKMTPDELKKQVEYLKELKNYLSEEHIDAFGQKMSRRLNELSKETNELIEYIQNSNIIDSDMIQRFQAKFEDITKQLENLANDVVAEFDEETIKSALSYIQSKLDSVMENGKEFADGLADIVGRDKAEQLKEKIKEFISELENDEDLEDLPEQLQELFSYYSKISEYAEKSMKITETIENMTEDILNSIDGEYERAMARSYITFGVFEQLGLLKEYEDSDVYEENIDPILVFGAEKAAQIEEKLPEFISLYNDAELNELLDKYIETGTDEALAAFEEKDSEIQKKINDIIDELTKELDEEIAYEIEQYMYSQALSVSTTNGEEEYIDEIFGKEKADEIRQTILETAEQLENDEEFMALAEELENITSNMTELYPENLGITKTIEKIAEKFNEKLSGLAIDIDEETVEKIAQYFAENLPSLIPQDIDIKEMLGQKKVTKLSMIAAKYMMKFNNDEELQELISYVQNWLSDSPQSIVWDIKDIYSSINWSGLETYSKIAYMVNNNNAGFDLIKTSDGVDFELVTDDGFGDRYNYGIPSMLATDEGLYMGTANPFYGSQLWLLTTSTGSNNIPIDNKGQNGNSNNNNSNTNNNNTGNNNTGNGNTGNTDSPATGDGRNVVPALAALMLSSAAVIAFRKRRSAK